MLVTRRRSVLGGHDVEAVQHRGRDEIVRAKRLDHRNTVRGSEVRDPVGDASVRKEPRGYHHAVGAIGAQFSGGVGDPRVRAGGERDLGACPARPIRSVRATVEVRALACFVGRAHRDDEHAEARRRPAKLRLGQS